jgi:hypothetical protein
MLESDSTRLRERIERADSAMRERLNELPETSVEKIDIESALKYLHILSVHLSTVGRDRFLLKGKLARQPQFRLSGSATLFG